jgi:hypothetical protein
MARKPARQLKLGDQLDGTVLRSNGGRRFLVKCPAVPQGWMVELHTRRPELIEEGGHVSFWVAKISPQQGEVLVHDGDYGRLPVSDAMRPRYVAGLRSLLGEVEPTGETLADAKAMLVQIEKRQSADWLTVWRLLGEPASGDVKRLRASIEAIQTARKEAREKTTKLLTDLEATYGETLRAAIQRLERG